MANHPEPPTVSSSAREIFLQALEADDPVRREGVLDSACGKDRAVRREVEALLEESKSVGDFLESPAVLSLREPPKVQLPSARVVEGSGDMIGPFTLLDSLGEGGCGMVYAAEQNFPVKRTVALKIIKLGMDTSSVIARFESERQALAMMDHPNIAKVLDAGATETGRPYFVMELVHGVPITEFCDQQKLPTDARLRLFIQVCQAIQHAHQKGIIHRDIKPSNILIAEGDEGPVPKVIDFGIAKATEQRLTEKTLFTAVESFIGTPAYMSPEQAEVGGIDIDTRSDIYSLGVLLYELLVGSPPFEVAELHRLSLDEMRRTIRESEPARPSQKFASLPGVEQVRIADCHDSDPARLGALLRGDLDWIVIECLEKDRARRYATASDLVSDIDRHLNAQPVLARPPSVLYRTTKLFRRHRAVISAATLLVLTLLGGIALSLTQAVRATRAEQEATEGKSIQERLRMAAERGEEKAKANAAAAALNEYVSDINLTYIALSEGNFGRAQQLIDKHRPLAGELDRRGFEWRYLANLCRGDDHVALPNQGSSVRGLAYSKDGQTLAVGLRDEVRLWNLRTNSLITSLPGGADSLLFLNDGFTLVTAGRNNVWVVDTRSWEEVTELPGETGPLALSADGTQLATSGRDGVRVWDTRQWFELVRLERALPGPVAFSPDGKFLATDGIDGITLWSLDDARPIRVLDDSAGLFDEGSANAMGYSADGYHIVAPRNTNSSRGVFVLNMWDVETGEEIGVLPNTSGHTGAIGNLGINPRQNILASASLDHSVALWDLEQQMKITKLSGHRSEVWSVALSPNGRRVASGSKDGDVRIWPTTPPGNEDSIARSLVPLTFSTDSRRLAAADGESTVSIYRLRDLQPLRSLPAGALCSMSADLETLAIARSTGIVEIVDVASLGRRELAVSTRPVEFLELVGDDGGTLLARSKLGPMHLWDLDEPSKPLLSLRVESAIVSGDGTTLVGFGLGDRVEVWNIDGRELVAEIEIPHGFGFSAALSHDGGLLATTGGLADSGNIVSLWDTESGELVGDFSGHKQSVRSIAFSPDGLTLASASGDGSLKLWNVTTRQELMSTRRLGSSLRGLKFSPDGRWLVGSSPPGSADAELRFFHAPEES